MSRLAKKPILIPAKTEVSVGQGLVRVKGPKGELSRASHPQIEVMVGADGVSVKPRSETLETRALTGTYVSHIRNMMQGVTQGYSKRLAVEGVGYKWDVAGKILNLSLGFSHPVKVAIPEGLTVTVDKSLLTISGINKELVGQFAANIRALKRPEPYKGKGIRYEGEVIRRKQGKKAA
ncbi:MAG: 50S ribosomal protein L6 [Patescibacteria group bacterium]|nr:50S ribosomal protein L6 [Patescibacteria group bacterium]